MKNLKISKWKRNNYCFNRYKKYVYYELVDFQTGKTLRTIKSNKDEVTMDGYYIVKDKYKVSCFNFKNKDWLRIGRQLFDLSDKSLQIRSNTSWPYLITEVIYKSKPVIVMKDFAPIRILNSKIDFTYDLLDFSMDFFAGNIVAKYILSQENNKLKNNRNNIDRHF